MKFSITTKKHIMLVAFVVLAFFKESKSDFGLIILNKYYDLMIRIE